MDSMFEPLALLGAGLLLGIVHASDPDHVVAVATIVSRQRSLVRAGAVGALWGVGHTLPLLVLGGAIVMLRLVIPPRLGLALEFGVALMLIVLGLANLLRRDHSRGTPALGRARPLAIGFVHGLAGTAAVALYVLTRISQPWLAMGSLVLFGVGTVAGMMLITGAIGAPALWASARFPRGGRYARLASGALSLAFGLFLAHQIGVQDGLFGASPHWSPR